MNTFLLNASLDILSCGIGGLGKHPERSERIRLAEVLFGSRTLLEQVDSCGISDRNCTRIVIGADAHQNALDALEQFRAGKRVVVLASGDALYHGFGGTLARLLQTAAPEECARVCYHPDITAFQALFHRLGLPWDNARLFSAHQDSGFSLREIVEAPLAVVYGGSRAPAHELAKRILAFHPASATRAAVMAEQLEYAQQTVPTGPITQDTPRTGKERIFRGTVAELATMPVGPTSMLVLLPTSELPSPMLALGLPEDVYDRENNLITPSDVRAVILARLRLPANGVLWDIGAGSGSVGLEAAALRPGLQVFGVEKHPDRIAMIERNRLRLGVGNHTTIQANALDLAPLAVVADETEPTVQRPTLPRPDRIFVGGGGEQLSSILDTCHAALKPGGLLIASAVTLETVHRLYAWAPERRIDLTALDISREQPLAGCYHQLKPQNRITLFTFCKPRDES